MRIGPNGYQSHLTTEYTDCSNRKHLFWCGRIVLAFVSELLLVTDAAAAVAAADDDVGSERSNGIFIKNSISFTIKINNEIQFLRI